MAMAGGAVAFAVLLRETFWPYSIVLGLLLVRDRRPFGDIVAYAAGGITVAAVVVLAIGMLRGGIEGLLGLAAAYRAQSIASGAPVWTQTCNAATAAVRQVWWVLPAVATGLVACMRPTDKWVRGLWLIALLTVTPIVDVLTLGAHPYRYTQFLLPASVLVAIGIETAIERCRRQPVWGRAVTVVVAVGWLLAAGWGPCGALVGAFEETRHFAPIMFGGDWESPVVDDSFYLAMAAQIRERTCRTDQIVTSGYMYALYGLAERLPVASSVPASGCLTTLMLSADGATRRQFATDVNDQPPSAIVISGRVPLHTPYLKSLIPGFEQKYEKTAHIPTGCRSYGAFSADLYTRQ